MTHDIRPDTLIDTNWGDGWEGLAEAPALIPRARTTQVTLRVSARSVGRLKAVAAAKSLPYHALARAWIIDGLRSPHVPTAALVRDEPKSAQLNLKVDQKMLDALKRKASELRCPYHALGRQYVEAALEREETELRRIASAVAR